MAYPMQVNMIFFRFCMRMLGKPSCKKKCFLSGIARITSPPPPLSGNLYIFFRTSKTTFCVYDSKNANYDNDGPMIIMMVILMIMITKNDQITYKY